MCQNGEFHMDNIDANALQDAEKLILDLELTSHVASSRKIKEAFSDIIACVSAITVSISKQNVQLDGIDDKINYLEEQLDGKLCVEVDLSSAANEGMKVAMTPEATLFIDDYIHLSGDQHIGFLELTGSLSARDVRAAGFGNTYFCSHLENGERWVEISHEASQFYIRGQTLQDIIDDSIQMDKSPYIDCSMSSMIVNDAFASLNLPSQTSDNAYCIDALSSDDAQIAEKNRLLKIYNNGTKVDCSIRVADKGTPKNLENLPATTYTFTSSQQCILYIYMFGHHGWGYTKSLKVKNSESDYLYEVDGEIQLEPKQCYIYVPANKSITIEATWSLVDTLNFNVDLNLTKVVF